MGKVFRRLVCFFLGLVIGAVATVGGVATSIYYMYGNITVQDLTNGNTENLGDINDYSIEDIIALLLDATKSPDDYTLRDLENKYGMDIQSILEKILGSGLITDEKINEGYLDDLKSISLFSLFSSDGVMGFLNNVSVGAILFFVPDNIISAQERSKLRKYTIGQLIETDEYTGQLGLFGALRDLTVGGLLNGMFKYDPVSGKYVTADGSDSPLNLIANIKLGAIIDTFVTGTSDLANEIVAGGLSSIGELTVGEVLSYVLGKSEIVERIDGLFNGMRIRELFSQDENGNYKFSPINLTDNVKIGGLLGYTYDDENGIWLDKDGKPAKGLLQALASFDATKLYLAITTGDGDVAKIVKNVLLSIGNLKIGDILETLGFEIGEDGYYTNGSLTLKSQLISSLANISIEDIVGEDDFNAKQVLHNLLNSISDYCGDLTIGEGVGELFGIIPDGNGGYKYEDSSKGEINYAVQRILDVKFADITDALAADPIDKALLIDMLRKPLEGVSVGDVLGYTKQGGVWLDAKGNEVSPILGVVADIEFSGLFAILDGDATVSAILEKFAPELSLGQVATAVIPDLTEDDGTYYFKGEAFTDGLSTVLGLKVWQIVSGFEKDGEFDLLSALKDVKVGELLDMKYDEESDLWCFDLIGGARYFTGAINKILGYKLGELLSPSDEYSLNYFLSDLKKITIGGIASTILGYKEIDGEVVNVNGGNVNPNLARLIKSTLSVGDIIDAITGKSQIDILGSVAEIFGDIRIGDLVQIFISEMYEGTDNDGSPVWYRNGTDKFIYILSDLFFVSVQDITNVTKANDVKGKILKAVEVVFGKEHDFERYLSAINGINKKSLYNTLKNEKIYDFVSGILSDDALGYIKEFVGDVYIGNIVDLFMPAYIGAYSPLYDCEWYRSSTEIYVEILNDLFSVKISDIFEVIDAEGVDGKILKAVEVVFGKENIFERYLWDVKYFAENDDVFGALLGEKVYDFAKGIIGDDRLDYLKQLFGEVYIGNIVALFTPATLKNGNWYRDEENVYIEILSDLFSVQINDIFDVIDAEGVEGKILKAVDVIFGDNEFARYLSDIDFIREKGIFNALLDEKVANFVRSVIGDDRVEYLKGLLGNIYIGEIVDLFARAELGGDGLWYTDPDTAYIEILSDIFSVKINDIFDVIDAEGVDGKIRKAVAVIFGEYTFGRYLGSIDYVGDKDFFNALLNEEVYNFVDKLLGDDRLDYLKELFGETYIGDS